MPENFLIRGLLIGLIFGVPAGAIGTLTIQRTLSEGFSAGLFTGLGSSAADVVYACAGIFGVTLVSDFLTAQQRFVSLLGGLLILAVGIRIFRQTPQERTNKCRHKKLHVCFASSFAIALANPATILSFLMAFAAFEITGTQTVSQSILLISGVLLGTLCWWSVLSGVTAVFRNRINERIYCWLNRLLGGMMLVFGAVVLLNGVINS